MNEIVDKSTCFKQVCQLLVSLIAAIVHPHLCGQTDSNDVNNF